MRPCDGFEARLNADRLDEGRAGGALCDMDRASGAGSSRSAPRAGWPKHRDRGHPRQRGRWRPSPRRKQAKGSRRTPKTSRRSCSRSARTATAATRSGRSPSRRTSRPASGARDIAAVTEERSMPPWKPTAGVGPKLKHDQSLTRAEIAVLAAWAEAVRAAGRPQGPAAAAHVRRGLEARATRPDPRAERGLPRARRRDPTSTAASSCPPT